MDVSAQLPVTAELAARLPRHVFHGLRILHINHLLDDLLVFNGILASLGAELIYVPVRYGADKSIPALPYTVVASSPSELGHQRFGHDIHAEGVAQSIQRAFDQMTLLPEATLVLLEDGGYHYQLLDSQSTIAGLAPVAAIEQTLAGVRAAWVRFADPELTSPAYPIISVARSRLKMRYENYFIAYRVVEELSILLTAFNDFLAHRFVLLIGYGVIGRALAHRLRGYHCSVTVYDKQSKLLEVAKAEGFETTTRIEPDVFQTVTVVVGATGQAAFTTDHLKAFLDSRCDDLYLASASSRDTEFAGIAEPLSDFKSAPVIQPTIGTCGTDYIISEIPRRRRLRMVADGYPVNFFRPHSQSLPPAVIDPIYAELLAVTAYAHQCHIELPARIHLFGHDFQPSQLPDEEEILQNWMLANRVGGEQNSTVNESILTVHPCEQLLTSLEDTGD